jgi:hypothetical protein
MKTDEKYSYITVCPETNAPLSDKQKSYSGGVCVHCGHDNDCGFTHQKKIVGRWSYPTLYERFFEGKRTEFLRKDEEDAIMDKLKGEYNDPVDTTKKDIADRLARYEKQKKKMKRVRY